MTRLGFFGILFAVFLVLTTSGLAVRTETAKPYPAIDTEAAVKASPELVGALSKELSATPEQAAGAAGALFGLAKSRLNAEDFSQLAKAVPGMDLLLQAAPAAGGAASAAGTGVAGSLFQLAESVGGLPAVAAGFSKLGLKPELAPKAVSTLVTFVTKSGGANLGSLLAGVLK